MEFFGMVIPMTKKVGHPWDTLIFPCCRNWLSTEWRVQPCLERQLLQWIIALTGASFPNLSEILLYEG
jgi:hypothetical protein